MRRSVFTLRTPTADVVGTRHTPIGWSAAEVKRPCGVLLLNPGPAPRAGNSDFSARLADELARSGVPCFRLDFAGLGDSAGESWTDILQYQVANERGVNQPTLDVVIAQLCEAHGLDGVYLGGLCAGATTALATLATSAPRIKGLMLFEPELRRADVAPLVSIPTPACGGKEAGEQLAHRRGLLVKLRDIDRVVAHAARFLEPRRSTAPLARMLRAWLLRRSERHLPQDALVGLSHGLRDALCAGTPALAVVAQGGPTDLYLERIGRAMKFERSARLTTVRLKGSNHLFTSEGAIEAAIDATVRWVATSEPARV